MRQTGVRSVILVAGLALAAFGLTGCNKLRARDQLNKGVNAFKNAQYSDAVENFKTAVELDPSFAPARLYLATAYMQQYIPGSESVENNRMAEAAHDEFMKVLDQVPNDKTAVAALASLYFNEKKFDDAQKWYEKQAAIDPSNPVAYYSLGVIAWSKWYPAYGAARAGLGMRQDDPGPIKDKKVREELKAQWQPVIQGGLQALDKALQADPQYDDAMAYENLLIRENADLADNKDDYEKQVKIANDWVDKALAMKKAKAEKKANSTQGGITAQ
jgi:tetratricopeptide (TPR) repeat protein